MNTAKPPVVNIEPLNQDSPVDSVDQTQHILIIMSDTGGGHRAAAEAIQEGLKLLYGDTVSVAIVDAWKDHVAWPVSYLAGTYGWIVNKALWLWKWLWQLEKKPYLLNVFYVLIYPLVAPGLHKLFLTQRPSIIVSVHPLLTPFSLLVLERTNLNIPFVTVVTDMIKSWQVWYRPSTTVCLVPTPAIGTQAVCAGIPPAKIDVVGQPVSPKFSALLESKTTLRYKLELNPCQPVVLLAGGGEGYGPVFEIARTISQNVTGIQLIIVAGRNKALQKKLESVTWEVPTLVFGFTVHMSELMKAADVFITKAGPGSLAEAFVIGLPLIIFDYIPGQEDDNVDYVLQHDAGVFANNPQDIADLLREWLIPNNPGLAQMADNAARLAQPEAALTIARCVYQLINQISS